MVQDLHEEVIRRMCDGDTAAYEQILDRHLGQVVSYVRRFLPVAAAADVEDIAQETLVRLWTSRATFEVGRIRVSTWLHRIAHNLCIDHIRREQRSLPPAEETMMAGPDRDVSDEDRANAVNNALMLLPERQRSALVLCHYQGLSNREAAEIMDISVDALESLLRRSREKLRTLLSQAT